MSHQGLQYGPCPEALCVSHHEEFARNGFLAFESVLSESEVTQLREAFQDLMVGLYDDLRADRAEVYAPPPGKPENYRGLHIHKKDSGFWIQFEPSVEDPAALSPEEAMLRTRKLAGFVPEHPAMQALSAHPRVQGLVEEILGAEAIMFGNLALCKPPEIGSEKPWHQDDAYFSYLPLDAIVTAWVALDDATVDNGCMFTIPGAHLGGVRRHIHGTDCQIDDGRLDLSQSVPVELKAGGVMFFSGLLPHQTPPNRSNRTRRAVQFQYRSIHTRKVSHQEYETAFREADGTPATCRNAALEAKARY